MVLKVRVLIPEKFILESNADEVILPGLTGQIGVLSTHAPLVTALETGLVRIKLNDKWTPIIVSGGFSEVSYNRVVVLATGIEELSNISSTKAAAEVEKATLAFDKNDKNKSLLDLSFELKKAIAQLEAINCLELNKL